MAKTLNFWFVMVGMGIAIVISVFTQRFANELLTGLPFPAMHTVISLSPIIAWLLFCGLYDWLVDSIRDKAEMEMTRNAKVQG